MINLKFLLGLIPKTANLESVEAALVNEYNELETYKTSDELKRFLELQKIIESPEFKKKEQELQTLVYKSTEEFKKETAYLALQKSQRIKNYLRIYFIVLLKLVRLLALSKDCKECISSFF